MSYSAATRMVRKRTTLKVSAAFAERTNAPISAMTRVNAFMNSCLDSLGKLIVQSFYLDEMSFRLRESTALTGLDQGGRFHEFVCLSLSKAQPHPTEYHRAA